jgi:hypothetical protein
MSLLSSNYKKAIQTYEKGGAAAVIHAVNEGFIKADGWMLCEPCDANQPVEADGNDHFCLVCGSYDVENKELSYESE